MALIRLVEKDTEDTAVRAMFRQIEKAFGDVSDNFRLAAVSPGLLKELLSRGAYLVLESGINPAVFAVIRYIVASKEHGNFCMEFNSRLLEKSGFTEEDFAAFRKGMMSSRLSPADNAIVWASLKVVYDPGSFSSSDIDELKGFGFTEKQIFDAAEHAANMLKMTKILKAFKI